MNKAASGTIKFDPLQCLYWDVALQKAFYWRGTKEAGSSLQNASYNGWNCRRFLLLPASPMYSLEGVEGLATLTVETWTSLRPEQPKLRVKAATTLIGFWQLATVLIMLINVRHHPPPPKLYHFDRKLNSISATFNHSMWLSACRIELNSSKLNLIIIVTFQFMQKLVSASLTVMLSVSGWGENRWGVQSTGGSWGAWG